MGDTAAVEIEHTKRELLIAIRLNDSAREMQVKRSQISNFITDTPNKLDDSANVT